MPSQREGLGLAAVEAMAASTPALLSNVPGLADIAAATQWTFLTSTSPESIAEGLTQAALMDPSERHNKSLADSVRIQERFSLQKGVRSIAHALYS